LLPRSPLKRLGNGPQARGLVQHSQSIAVRLRALIPAYVYPQVGWNSPSPIASANMLRYRTTLKPVTTRPPLPLTWLPSRIVNRQPPIRSPKVAGRRQRPGPPYRDLGIGPLANPRDRHRPSRFFPRRWDDARDTRHQHLQRRGQKRFLPWLGAREYRRLPAAAPHPRYLNLPPDPPTSPKSGCAAHGEGRASSPSIPSAPPRQPPSLDRQACGPARMRPPPVRTRGSANRT